MDQDAITQVYMSIVKLVTRELRMNKIVRLPYLADVALVSQRPRLGWRGKDRVYMDARDVLKFYPQEKMRRYFNRRQNEI